MWLVEQLGDDGDGDGSEVPSVEAGVNAVAATLGGAVAMSEAKLPSQLR